MRGSSIRRHASGRACTLVTTLALLLALPISCHPELAFIPQGGGLKHHSPTAPSRLQLCLIAARPGASKVSGYRQKVSLPSLQQSPWQHPGWRAPRCPRSSPGLRAAGDGNQGAGDASAASERSEFTQRESSASEASDDYLLFAQDSVSSGEASQEAQEAGGVTDDSTEANSATATGTAAGQDGRAPTGSEKGAGGKGMRVRSSILARPFAWVVRAVSWLLNKVSLGCRV